LYEIAAQSKFGHQNFENQKIATMTVTADFVVGRQKLTNAPRTLYYYF
jgi:hypothetical protein